MSEHKLSIYMIYSSFYELNLFTTKFDKINDIIAHVAAKTGTSTTDWEYVEIKEEEVFETSERFYACKLNCIDLQN